MILFSVWDEKKGRTLKEGDTVVWIHDKRHLFPHLSPEHPSLVKKIMIVEIQGDVLRTDFGNYDVSDGKHIFDACGCDRFCDCYGRLYLETASDDTRS